MGATIELLGQYLEEGPPKLNYERFGDNQIEVKMDDDVSFTISLLRENKLLVVNSVTYMAQHTKTASPKSILRLLDWISDRNYRLEVPVGYWLFNQEYKDLMFVVRHSIADGDLTCRQLYDCIGSLVIECQSCVSEISDLLADERGVTGV